MPGCPNRQLRPCQLLCASRRMPNRMHNRRPDCERVRSYAMPRVRRVHCTLMMPMIRKSLTGLQFVWVRSEQRRGAVLGHAWQGICNETKAELLPARPWLWCRVGISIGYADHSIVVTIVNRLQIGLTPLGVVHLNSIRRRQPVMLFDPSSSR